MFGSPRQLGVDPAAVRLSRVPTKRMCILSGIEFGAVPSASIRVSADAFGFADLRLCKSVANRVSIAFVRVGTAVVQCFGQQRRHSMPRGSKAKYTSKQKRQAEHIEEGYEKRGVGRKEAARRAWSTVNKETGGGKKSGSGRGKRVNRSASRRGGRRSHARS
jgi:hypothetical protein